MIPLCRLCHLEPALPGRTVGRTCYRLSQRKGMNNHRGRPQPLEWFEFEEMQEAVEGRTRGREAVRE